jgi:hypothetical protein
LKDRKQRMAGLEEQKGYLVNLKKTYKAKCAPKTAAAGLAQLPTGKNASAVQANSTAQANSTTSANSSSQAAVAAGT